MDSGLREQLRSSLVTVHQSNDSTGMGVYLGKRLFITAAHCLPESPDVTNPFGDVAPITLSRFGSSQRFRAVLAGIDFCSDFAVLADETSHGVRLEGKHRREFDSQIAMLLRAAIDNELDREFVSAEYSLMTHEGHWSSGQFVPPLQDDRFIQFTPDENDVTGFVRPGTSGSPLFDNHGRVLGLVSTSSETADRESHGMAVRLATAIPQWLLRQLQYE